MKRLKIRTAKGDLRGEIENDSSTLEEWICDNIPPAPEGQKFEYSDHDWGEYPWGVATTFMYVIKDGHVCYTYLCEGCAEEYLGEEYLDPEEYPTTKDGYAVSPRHCT